MAAEKEVGITMITSGAHFLIDPANSTVISNSMSQYNRLSGTVETLIPKKKNKKTLYIYCPCYKSPMGTSTDFCEIFNREKVLIIPPFH